MIACHVKDHPQPAVRGRLRILEEEVGRPVRGHDARLVADGLDVHALEQDWRQMWLDSGCPELHAPEKAFVAFCRRRAERARG